MEKSFMVETEFLFGFQPKDRHYNIVTSILEAYAATRPFPLYYPVSALIETREVLAGHGKSATERLNAITLMKTKAISFQLLEAGLSSDDLILCEDLLIQHRFLTFFDGLHASVSLNNKFSVISNDEVYGKLGIERLSFAELLDFLKR